MSDKHSPLRDLAILVSVLVVGGGLVLYLFASIRPGSSETWEIHRFQNPMDDTTQTLIVDPASSGRATLNVLCGNGKIDLWIDADHNIDGNLDSEVTLLRYRADHLPTSSDMWRLDSKGRAHSVTPAALSALIASTEVTFELPIHSSPEYIRFRVTGLKSILDSNNDCQVQPRKE